MAREQLGTTPSRPQDAATVDWVLDQFAPHVTTILSAPVPAYDVSYPHTCLDIMDLHEDITSMTAGQTGTPDNFWKLMIRIRTDNAQHIAWGSYFSDSGAARLPLITQPGMTHQVGLEYNLVKRQWICLASDVLGY